ncbi:OmpA family protein [Hymenobacter sp. BT683]|uniref:OmpA family protein n=1 Tax=Hymenobacter jeongseonensis TaxID=2791027 RepID=A0ABS0IDG5_9BACT|nr:OmpA family protein [Hymenobacter jeongseonensis]MBF9235895.1 OmpA family protein [Hymenobacter jeongseonensis]
MKLFSTFLALGLALTSFAGQAQDTALSLMGNVQSDDQKSLAGAAVTVIHLPSGTRYAAAANEAGRFSIANLQAGGPYLMRVGGGGYRPQTVESIFLEKGKTATFTITLSKLETETTGKTRSGRHATTAVHSEALAAESVVGGPVLITTSSNSYGTAKAPPQSIVASIAAAAPVISAPKAASPGASGPNLTAKAARPARYRRGANDKPEPTKGAAPLVGGHFDAASGNYIYETGSPISLKLPSGAVIKEVGDKSTESNLYRFLTNPKAQIDTVDLTHGWYNFDRVFFHAGKATLTAESLNQLKNVAAILRAFPQSRIKLGGYTDSTGTSKVNRQLSEARARMAWSSLVDMGISPGRIDARGYGPRYAIAPNTTEEGRAMNRRLSLKVLQK